MNPIPTPLTNAVKVSYIHPILLEIKWAVDIEFARNLERENHLLRKVMNKATEFADGFPAHLSHCTCEYCALAKAIKDYHTNIQLIDQPETKGD